MLLLILNHLDKREASLGLLAPATNSEFSEALGGNYRYLASAAGELAV